ncbi:MAG: PGF-CTERM sorting domain-containing protein [Methanosarcinaceae archaeon]|nr:PGF-CTERM sorting domain-containing protein [Methanosarcinaceae archaeon]
MVNYEKNLTYKKGRNAKTFSPAGLMVPLIGMRRLFCAAAVLVLASLVLAAGCTSAPSQAGHVTIRGVDISIPDGQPPSNVTHVTVVPYLDAVYAAVDGVDLQVSAKEAGTDIVVAETVLPIGNLTSGRTAKEEIELALENGRRYDIWVTVWQDGRMRESGSVNVFLPDRTAAGQRLAYSLLSVSALDVMTPEIDADPITLDIVTEIENSGGASGNLAMEIRAVNLQTGITAVRESRPLGAVSGDSTTKKVSLTVPNGYDYEIRIRLIEDGAAFATSTGRITLAPQPQVILADGTVFSPARSTSPVALPFPTPAPTPGVPSSAQVGQFRVQSSGAPIPTSSPGFEAGLAAAGLLGAGLARRRR